MPTTIVATARLISALLQAHPDLLRIAGAHRQADELVFVGAVTVDIERDECPGLYQYSPFLTRHWQKKTPKIPATTQYLFAFFYFGQTTGRWSTKDE